MLDLVTNHKYRLCLMDVNLGQEASTDFTYARQVQEILRSRIEQGLVRFCCYSASGLIVRQARAEGLPTEDKTDFGEILKELEKN
jgi:hypothetical protein